MYVQLFEKDSGRSVIIDPTAVRAVLPHEKEGHSYIDISVGPSRVLCVVQGEPHDVAKRLGFAYDI